jgi:fluoroquinolone transport system ATP-binding protein
MKDLILDQKQRGKTILLTTHNMYDATELCDHVAFIVDGQIRALDTPHNLIMKRGASKIVYTYLENGREISREIPLETTKKDENLKRLIENNALRSIHSSEPTLNAIFAELTGRKLQ